MRLSGIALAAVAVLAGLPCAWGDASRDAAKALFGGTPTLSTSLYQLGLNPGETMTIEFLARPLIVGGMSQDWIQLASDGTASHVQIVVKDSNGNIVDNFGLTSSKASIGTEDARIERQTPSEIRAQYDPVPCGVVQMTAADYIQARDASISQAWYYTPLNSVDLERLVLDGALKGNALNRLQGMLAGMVVGAKIADSRYDAGGWKELGNVSDSSSKMSFPALNCHYLPILFMRNADGRYTVIQPYVIPGQDEVAQPETASSEPQEEGAAASSCEEERDPRSALHDGIGESVPEESPKEDVPPPPPPDAAVRTPEGAAVAWLRAYNAHDPAGMIGLSTPQYADLVRQGGAEDFPEPARNWRDAAIETTRTESRPINQPSDPDLEPVEITVHFLCTGADSTTYDGGIAVYKSKSTGLFKVGFALFLVPE